MNFLKIFRKRGEGVKGKKFIHFGEEMLPKKSKCAILLIKLDYGSAGLRIYDSAMVDILLTDHPKNAKSE